MPVLSNVTPSFVVLTASSDPELNLSDEAYAAFKEAGVVTHVAAISGQPQTEADTFGRGVRAGRRPATNVTLKEKLDAAQVEEMLAEEADWKLAIPNGSATDVLTKDMLQEAWSTAATGTVKKSLRGINSDEQALLDHAKENLTPKAGMARFTAALGAPVTNIALVAGAAALFAAVKPDDPRPWLLVAAGAFALVAVVASLLGSGLLKRSTVQLSRLDLLAKREGPPISLSNVSVAAFALAVILAFCSAAFPEEAASSPSVTFGDASTTQAGARTKVSFQVKWADLDKSRVAVRTVVAPPGRADRVTVTPKASDGAVTQDLTLTVAGPTTFSVSSQALDEKRQPIGDMTTHTYEVP